MRHVMLLSCTTETGGTMVGWWPRWSLREDDVGNKLATDEEAQSSDLKMIKNALSECPATIRSTR